MCQIVTVPYLFPFGIRGKMSAYFPKPGIGAEVEKRRKRGAKEVEKRQRRGGRGEEKKRRIGSSDAEPSWSRNYFYGQNN